MRVALGQFNAVVGDMVGNARKMREIYATAVRADVDLLAFPELAVCGYPPEDLLHKRHFLKDCSRTLDKFAADCPDGTIVVGFAGSDDIGQAGQAFNALMKTVEFSVTESHQAAESLARINTGFSVVANRRGRKLY